MFFATTLAGQVETATSPDALQAGRGHVEKILKNRFSRSELDAFLLTRIPGQFLGDFNSYTSLLYAVHHVPIWNDDMSIERVQLESWYPPVYKPTIREALDCLARQVKCSWTYNFDTGYFVFEKGPMPYPHSLHLQPSWTTRDQGSCIVYLPPTAPVGMDVYILGRVTAAEKGREESLQLIVRDSVARKMARNFKQDLSDSDFSDVQVDGVNASYFEVLLPQPNRSPIRWRQWSLVKRSWSILIVSAISSENEATIFPDVKQMIASFDVPESK